MNRSLLVALALFAACGREASENPASNPKPPTAEAPAGPHTVRVCATASLRRAFEAIAARYEQDHSGATVKLHFDGGTQILNALNAGEKCDVIALGENSVMARVASAGHTAVGSPTELARNHVAIVVAAGNPKQVKGLADFARGDLRIALGARTSSIGRHSSWVLSRLKLRPTPASEATTADGVLARVASGEADVGIVYVTTFVGGGAAGVESIAVPEGQNTPALYSISVAREPAEPRGAAAFYELALGPDGQALLHEAGFRPIGDKLP
jgi:molybdate transport system substrate-binding protein